MRRYISDRLGSFPDLCCGLQIFRSHTPTLDDNGDEDTNLYAERAPMNRAADEARLENPKEARLENHDEARLENTDARVTLEHLSSFRIQENALNFNSTQSHARGGKAQVVKAILRRGDRSEEKQVAVKKLHYYNSINKRKFGNEFVREVDMTARLSHDNIVELIGFVEELQEGKAWIILAWEPNGNVSEFLAKGEWEIPERMSLIQDTFAGLQYLHTHQPPICHGDLKSLNILVSASYRAVITDFGSARSVGETEDPQEDWGKAPNATGAATGESTGSSQITLVASGSQLTLTGPAWSLRWAAPEVAMGKQQNLASDIWAAGWVCWEIMTNKVPFPEFNAEGIIILKVVHGEVPVAREDTQLSQITRLCSLMEDCWIFDPTKRPDIAQCNNEVKRMPSIPPLGGKPSDSKDSSPELLYQKGRIHSGQGNLQEAISLFQQMLSKTSASDQDASARALFELGRAHYLKSNYSEAEQYLTRAQDIFAQIDDDSGRATAVCWLAKMYRRQYKSAKAENKLTEAEKKSTQAEESFTQAIDIYSRLGNDKERASALLGLGNLFHDRFQYPEAEEFYKQTRDIYDRLGDVRGQANTLRGLGKLHQDCSEYTTAEESYNQALEIFTRIGDNVGRANVTQSLGHLYRLQGLNTKAAPLFAEAKDLYMQVGDSKMVELCSDWLEVTSKQGGLSTTSPPLAGDASVSSPSHQQ